MRSYWYLQLKFITTWIILACFFCFSVTFHSNSEEPNSNHSLSMYLILQLEFSAYFFYFNLLGSAHFCRYLGQHLFSLPNLVKLLLVFVMQLSYFIILCFPSLRIWLFFFKFVYNKVTICTVKLYRFCKIHSIMYLPP